MINENSLKAVHQATFSKQFRRPLYDSYCFSNLPGTIRKLFTGEGKSLPEDTYSPGPYDHVVLLFLDGFGWRFFEKYHSSLPTLEALERGGIVSKITSMFPSTTAAHVTSINTGLTPGESGIYEWFFYEPKLKEIIAPLPFSYAGDRKAETLPLRPKDLFPFKTLYESLSEIGVRSFAAQPKSIAHSTYSTAMLKGAEILPYESPKKGLQELASRMRGKSYSYFYFAEIDAIGHRKGIFSREFSHSIQEIFEALPILLDRLPPKTAVLLTADHGMVDVDPRNTFYLNEKISGIQKHLQFGQRDKPLAPAGSCRDFFLHVREESVEELRDILNERLEGRAEVFETATLLDQGFFGPVSEKLRSRIGNLVILSYPGEAVWWMERGRFQQNFFAAHGGLTPEEMETLCLFYQN